MPSTVRTPSSRAARFNPGTFDERVAERDGLDQHFTRLWLDFAITGMSTRPMLDDRTRLLVLIGQYTMAKSHAALEDTIRAAIAASVAAREILEIVLQCVVYGGHTTVEPAIAVFHRVARGAGSARPAAQLAASARWQRPQALARPRD
jgi:4-carboxymuconolactone decarboxylase